MITTKSTYDEIVKEINDAAAEVTQDAAYDGMELSEDEVWTDLATAYLIDAKREVAEEVCRIQLGFVPGQLLNIWRAQDEAKDQAKRKKALERAAAKRDEKGRAEAAERAAQRDAIRAARCSVCFTVPSPSGACNC